MELTDDARALLDGPNFATVATLNPDGAPHTSVVWYVRDGDTILFSTRTDRRKARNLARDPRISLTVFDVADPYHAIDIRGTAELVDDPAKELPDRLSRRYLGQDAPPEPDEYRRYVVRVTPLRVTGFRA